jgi:two-component system, response regulator PdtaR
VPHRKPERIDILVVEDDVVVRTILAEVLREVGLRVIEADNADEAWSYLQSGAPVDLVISDIRMPGSMDGLALADKIKESYDSIHIILTSAVNIDPSTKTLDRLITKPYSLKNMIETVLAMLKR